jgi:transposase
MPRIPEDAQKKIVQLRKKKVPVLEIAKRLNLSRSTIMNYCKEAGIYGPKNHSGRPKKLSQEASVSLCKAFLHNKVQSLDEGKRLVEKKFNTSISRQTVSNCLTVNKIKCYKKVKKPLLTEKHREKRLLFSNTFSDFSFFDWKNVIWSDECKFALSNTNRKEYCWKRKSDPLKDTHIKKTLKFGGGAIMTWGCITSKGVGRLVKIDGIMTAEKYIEILADGLLGTLEDHDLKLSDTLFMQDNDPKHTAKRTKEWLHVNQVKLLDWPAQSPDMNPIENLWNIIDQKIRKRKNKPANVNELWEAVQQEWNGLDKQIIRNLYVSMTSRIAALKKAKGGYTKY